MIHFKLQSYIYFVSIYGIILGNYVYHKRMLIFKIPFFLILFQSQKHKIKCRITTHDIHDLHA